MHGPPPGLPEPVLPTCGKRNTLAKPAQACTIDAVSDKHANARIELIHGSMFSGKTEYLIARLRQERSQGKCVKAFKHAIDDRYDPDHLVTHQGDRFDAVRVSSAAAILDLCDQAEVVAIDEGHFFTTALITVVKQLVERGVSVIVAGISHDAWGRPFEPIPQLAQIADERVVLQAPCRICGAPAPFTQRMTPVNTPHMVGGLDDYEPRCAEHFTPLPGPPEER
jgi:thymidine kinase